MNLQRVTGIIRIAKVSQLNVLRTQHSMIRNCGCLNSVLPKIQYHITRKVSTVETHVVKKENSFKKTVFKLLFSRVKKSRLTAIGYFLYERIADNVNYLEFFEEFDLPDTFYSWFVITELHIWMLAARVMAEDDDGKIIRNAMVEALWSDVGQRVKKLGEVNPASTRRQVQELSEQLQAALIAYDEGLQSNDVVLAGALWRRIFQQGEVYPEQLELLVQYVRKQIKSLDIVSKENLYRNIPVEWDAVKIKS